MERVRPRPWQVFFALWIPMGALVLWLLSGSNPHRLTDEIHAKGKRMQAHVVGGSRDHSRGGGSTATVRLTIPSARGKKTCRSTLTVREFERLLGDDIPVTVIDGPEPRCYTETAYGMIEQGEVGEPFLSPMLFGAMLAWLLYYPIIRVRWSAAGSLKSRWDAERAAARAQPRPPSQEK